MLSGLSYHLFVFFLITKAKPASLHAASITALSDLLCLLICSLDSFFLPSHNRTMQAWVDAKTLKKKKIGSIKYLIFIILFPRSGLDSSSFYLVFRQL